MSKRKYLTKAQIEQRDEAIVSFLRENFTMYDTELAAIFGTSHGNIRTLRKAAGIGRGPSHNQRRAQKHHQEILAYIQANPTASDRQTAKEMHCSASTVRGIRKKEGIPVRKHPLLRQANAAALRTRIFEFIKNNPRALNVDVAEALGCSMSTVSSALRGTEMSGRSPSRRVRELVSICNQHATQEGAHE